MPAIVKNNQSLLDLAVQTAGSVEAAFDIALANDLPLSGDLQTGAEIATVGALKKAVVNEYLTNNIVPATAELTPLDRTFDYTFDLTFN